MKELGVCPDCGRRVEGEWKGPVIVTFCETCSRFLLEDEVDWDKANEDKK